MSDNCYKIRTAEFFKKLGFEMDVTEGVSSWDEQVQNAAAFAYYVHTLQQTELDRVIRKLTKYCIED